MAKNRNFVRETKKIYSLIRPKIESRLQEFERLWKEGSEKEVFAELVFCLLTPQSKAKSCFAAVNEFIRNDLLFKGSLGELSRGLNCVRFKNNKAKYILNARKLFVDGSKISIKSRIRQFKDVYQARDWLARNVKGMGYKEASHFLRNIGMGKGIAILDRHILRNLRHAGVIKKVPDTMSREKYLEIEGNMKEFAKRIKIPVTHLDLVFWYKETGEIFK